MSNKWIPNVAKAKSSIFKNFEKISAKNEFFSKKEPIEKKNYDYKDDDFPDLNKCKKSKKDTENESESENEKKNNWCDIINKQKPEKVESKKKIIQNKKIEEWCEEDQVNEKFDLFYTDVMLDIHYTIRDYCKEKFLPFYNKYDSYHNLVKFIKDNSSIYNSLYSDEESESDETELESEFNENSII